MTVLETRCDFDCLGFVRKLITKERNSTWCIHRAWCHAESMISVSPVVKSIWSERLAGGGSASGSYERWRWAWLLQRVRTRRASRQNFQREFSVQILHTFLRGRAATFPCAIRASNNLESADRRVGYILCFDQKFGVSQNFAFFQSIFTTRHVRIQYSFACHHICRYSMHILLQVHCRIFCWRLVTCQIRKTENWGLPGP